MKHLHGITVLVLGLGESGLAMARWAARCGATVRVWDSRDAPPHAQALAEHVPQATRLRGALDADALAGVRLVLKSPGLSPHDPQIAAPLDAAADTGVLVQGELELFAQALADLKAERGYAPKVIAITGTNGKTTTTAMTALLVERSGRRVAMAGNIGPTMLQTLSDALDATPTGAADVSPDGAPADPVDTGLPEVWVLELSSFQLDGVKGFEPDAATVLNITQDHLDWHGAMPAYVAAKARIFGKQAVMVINRDDPQVERLVPEPTPVKGRHARPIEREVLRFGLDAPRRAGDFGLVVENDMAWLVRALEADETLRRGRGAKADEAAEELHLQRLMPVDALQVRGRHNAANALAALALASAIGCPLAPLLHGLREYAGEPHRVEFIATVAGVDAFDDSKGTNVGATVAALGGLGADKAPAKLVVILGGDGKGQDFAPLADGVRRHARAVATIGRDAAAIEQAIAGAGVRVQRHDSLEAATRWCFEAAQPGDAVLLSPACASLDMFRNYAHRAEVFVAVVREIAADHGEVL
jgi:UDP-N-acetylmuramoylalanine--D-glutamate ligase